MAITLDSIRKGKAQPGPLRMVLAGSPGIGKTTFACRFPAPVVIQTEDGLEPLIHTGTLSEDVGRFEKATTYGEVMEAIEALTDGEHQYRTLVLDSLDWLEPLIWDQTCKYNNWASIETPGYGKGYIETDKFWGYFLDAINTLRDKRNMHIVLIAHTEIKKYESPDEPTYDRYQVALHKRAHALFTEWADIQAIAKPKNLIRTTTEGSGKMAKESSKALATTERILIFSDQPSAVAKNRYSLPPTMPLDYPTFAAAINRE